MLIGGEWTGSNQRIDVFNPARPDELVGTVPRGTPDDVVRAIAAAKAAQPVWASKSYSERAEIIAPLLQRLADDLDERTVLYVRENGKTTPEAKGELTGIPSRQRFTLDLAAELDQRHAFESPNGKSFVGYLPFGVVVSIVPWMRP
jgi:acyl-CoA reductase-like NAD-dependent aldehyde dehydrogenase